MTSHSSVDTLLSRAQEIAYEFEFPREDLRKATKHFIQQMSMLNINCGVDPSNRISDDGLMKNGTTLAQIPSYVTAIPNGSEEGTYLAVDLGGTNFRVCSVELHGDSTYSLTQTKTPIPHDLMVASTCKHLFNFLARRIEDFLRENLLEHMQRCLLEQVSQGEITDEFRRRHYLCLGFTFSFAFEQYSLDRGALMKWTKGFDIADAIGRDPCAMLQDELDLLAVPVLVTALVNDTVGTLMARSYTSPEKTTTLLGAIFGTGTNGAYVEKLSNINKLHPLSEFNDFKLDDYMVINTEWGGFDDELSVLPSTSYDIALDLESVNPKDQMFEKRISGMYLGEICRRAIVFLVETAHFDMHVSPRSKLWTKWGVDSSLLSIVAADHSDDLRIARAEIEAALGGEGASVRDARAIKLVSEAVARRAARLASVAIAAIVLQSGRLSGSPSKQPVLDQSRSKQPATTTSSANPYMFSHLVSVLATARHRVFNYINNTLTRVFAWARTSFNIRGLLNKRTQTSDDAKVANALSSPSETPANELPTIDIGLDGSLVEFYPNFEDIIRGGLRDVEDIGVAGERQIQIGLAKDGSGVGAALIARAAEQQARRATSEGPRL